MWEICMWEIYLWIYIYIYIHILLVVNFISFMWIAVELVVWIQLAIKSLIPTLFHADTDVPIQQCKLFHLHNLLNHRISKVRNHLVQALIHPCHVHCPCPSLPHPHISWTPPAMATPHLPAEPMPVSHQSSWEDIVPNIQPEAHLVQLKAIPLSKSTYNTKFWLKVSQHIE